MARLRLGPLLLRRRTALLLILALVVALLARKEPRHSSSVRRTGKALHQPASHDVTLTQAESPTTAQPRNTIATVHFLTPVSNRYENLIGLLKSLARSDDQDYVVHVVDFVAADGESWRDRLLGSGANIDYLPVVGLFSKTMGLAIALNRVEHDESVCCVMDADMRLPRSFVAFARKHVVAAKKAVLLSVANVNADGSYSSGEQTGRQTRPLANGTALFAPEFLLEDKARRNGGAGLMLFAKRDALAAGGMATGRFVNKTTWGDEDSDFSGRMRRVVNVVPVYWRDVVHVSHPRRCSEWYRGMFGDKICKPSPRSTGN